MVDEGFVDNKHYSPAFGHAGLNPIRYAQGQVVRNPAYNGNIPVVTSGH